MSYMVQPFLDGYFRKAVFPDYLNTLNGKVVAEKSQGVMHSHGKTPEDPSSSPVLMTDVRV